MYSEINIKPSNNFKMQNYFENCKTLDEAKKLYWDLAKQFHPDKEGGSKEAFQELGRQFENFQPEKEKYKGETEQWNAPEYMHVINQLMKIPEIVIEICGSWIWVSGNTKPHKEEIKAVHTGDSLKKPIWHSKKEMWYVSPVDYRKFSKKETTMDEIRDFYGSHKVNRDEKEEEKTHKKVTA